MTSVYSLEDFHEFYERWGPSVQTYCRLFLGDKERAEESTSTTFFTYFREAGKLFRGIKDLPLDRLPISLLRTTLLVAKRSWTFLSPCAPDDSSLEGTLPSLPSDERTVFILRGCLALNDEQIALATSFSREDVQALWARALLQLKTSWLDESKRRRDQALSDRPSLEGA